MTHCAIGFGPVPVALTCLDVSNVANLDLASLGFCGDPPAARGDDQDMIAIVNMPAVLHPWLKFTMLQLKFADSPGSMMV